LIGESLRVLIAWRSGRAGAGGGEKESSVQVASRYLAGPVGEIKG
jgi:hypothetical protein